MNLPQLALRVGVDHELLVVAQPPGSSPKCWPIVRERVTLLGRQWGRSYLEGSGKDEMRNVRAFDLRSLGDQTRVFPRGVPEKLGHRVQREVVHYPAVYVQVLTIGRGHDLPRATRPKYTRKRAARQQRSHQRRRLPLLKLLLP